MSFKVEDLRRLIAEALGNAYKVLGVPKNASQDEIKSAFRKLVATMHPDKNPGNQAIADRFKKMSAAYNAISDADKRKVYDLKGDRFVDDDGPVGTPRPGPTTTNAPKPPPKSDFRQQAADEKARWEQQRKSKDGGPDYWQRQRAREEEKRAHQSTSMPTERIFTNTRGTSNKFWSVTPRSSSNGKFAAEVRWGRIGSTGQYKVHSFPSRESMISWVNIMIDSKLRKGYRETTAQRQAPPPPPKNEPPKAEPKRPGSEAKTAPKPPGTVKSYRIYGKKGSAPVHTRVGGKVYAPHKSTRFKNGDKANVGVGSDGRISVNNPDNNWTQTWDPTSESVNHLIDHMVVQHLVEVCFRR